jgi:hypothetical protein
VPNPILPKYRNAPIRQYRIIENEDALRFSTLLKVGIRVWLWGFNQRQIKTEGAAFSINTFENHFPVVAFNNIFDQI